MKMILPACVAEAMQEWIGDVYDTAGETAFSMADIEKTRAAVAATFGAPVDTISLIKNTSEGVSIIAQGFPWREGDNVVISDIEHENNTFPWRYLKSRGVETRFAKSDVQGRVTLDCYRPLVDKRTRILALAWVAAMAIARICRNSAPSADRGVKLVDGIRGIGLATRSRRWRRCDDRWRLSADFLPLARRCRRPTLPSIPSSRRPGSSLRAMPIVSSTATPTFSAASSSAARPSSFAPLVSITSRRA
jgi:hypothetical protein